MKFFSWVQNKLSGNNQSISKQETHSSCHKNEAIKPVYHKEEFSDWPNGVLSIGTLFDKSVKGDTKEEDNEPKENSQQQGFTSEEYKQLQKELNALISSSGDLDCLSGFEAENNNTSSSNNEEEYQDDQDYTIIPNNANDVYLDNNMSNNGISKKSLAFLLKKMFICRGGFVPTPTFSLRDPTLLSPPKTRMNKILRALLRKKIYPQTPSPTMSRMKAFENKQQTRSNNNLNNDNDEDDTFYLEGSDSGKWVKTDTEYIVLEI